MAKTKKSKDSSKVGFFNSIKFKVILITFLSVLVTFSITELILLTNSKATISKTNQNYLYDMAVQTGSRLDKEFDVVGYDAAMDYDALASIFKGMGIIDMKTSYIYVVAADATMMYHPTQEKVGNPVTNEVVKGVAEGLAKGQNFEPKFVQYIFKGAAKYAAYYVATDEASGQKAIVVATVDEDEIMASQKKLTTISTIVGIIVLIAAVGIGFVVASFIANPIINITKVINKTGDLDFTKDDTADRLSVRTDETGLMARAVKTMTGKMVDVVRDIKQQGEDLKRASTNLNGAAAETSSTVEQVEKAVSEIADGAASQADETQKATESIILMGNMVEETNTEVNNLSEAAAVMKESGDAATDILAALSQINEKAKESIDVIYEQTNTTNSSANKIREATTLITSIAEETNLLSLNASIEAARAGEQGRGFAVVASQISKLAEQSNESARQIEAIIDSLIADSAKSVETMEGVQKIMEEQAEKVDQTVEVFGKVKEGIGTSITSVNNIADKTKKLDEARVTVVDVVQNLTAIAEENAASTQETSTTVADVNNIILNISKDANDLDDIAYKLHEQVELFTI
ncbi:MAG: methyl-accepting chemotaxis protein [Lachnospiraceae bacterium]|nr:methyl-accepting chemotaxis protein [Lachnospiraceae bacterium]